MCLHLFAKDDRSCRMRSSGTRSLSLVGSLFQTKANVRPRAAPSLRILSTRNCPNAHTLQFQYRCHDMATGERKSVRSNIGELSTPKCPNPTTPILWEEEMVAMSSADGRSRVERRSTPNNTHPHTHTHVSYCITHSDQYLLFYCSTHQIILHPSSVVCLPTCGT